MTSWPQPAREYTSLLEFSNGKSYFTSPNSSNAPPQLHPPTSATTFPSDLRSRRWALDLHPYLAFVPAAPFIGSFRSWFGTPVDRMHLEHDKHGWHLPLKVQKTWKNFEHTTRGVAHCLSKHLLSSNRRFQGLWKVPEKPGSYGYFTAHKSEAAARTSIAESIDAFVIVMSYLAFLVCLCQIDPSRRHYDLPLTEVFEGAGVDVHSEWINCIGTFVGPQKRLGCIVDIGSCAWTALIPYMLEVNIPIWLFWGSPPFKDPTVFPWSRPLMPQLRRQQGPPQTVAPSQRSDPTLQAFPPVKPNSGQRPGETMRAFFQRRKEIHALRRLKETPSQRGNRLNKLKQQARKPCPGKQGPKVYRWETVDDSPFRIRTIMSRGEVEDCWSSLFSRNQKFFNPFENEWDCSTEWSFNPEEGEESFVDNQPDWNDDSESDDGTPVLAQSVLPSSGPSAPSSRQTMDIDMPKTPAVPSPSKQVDHVEAGPPAFNPPILPSSGPSSPWKQLTDIDMQSSPAVPSPSKQVDHVEAGTPAFNPPILPSSGPSSPLKQLTDIDMQSSPAVPSPGKQVDQFETGTPALNPILPSSGPSSPSKQLMDIDMQSSPAVPSPGKQVGHSSSAPASGGSPPLPLSEVVDVSEQSMLVDHPDPPLKIPSHGEPLGVRADLDSVFCSPSGGLVADPRGDVQEAYVHNSDILLAGDRDRDLFTDSRDDVLAFTPLASTVANYPQENSFFDMMYYRYGYVLDEAQYTGLPRYLVKSEHSFKSWNTVLHAVGGKDLARSEVADAPVSDFLHALLVSERRPFHDVPAKYWDLSWGNRFALKHAEGSHFRVEVRRFHGALKCLLHSREDAVASWAIAVYPMIALEIARRRIGPSEFALAEFLIDRGIPFHTLAPLSGPLGAQDIGPSSSDGAIPILGTRQENYVFDVADYATYEAKRDSVFLSKPECRFALCFGGIVARLAREVLPSSVVLEGPSQSALDGAQAVFRDDAGNVMVDDQLSESLSDLISGTYATGTKYGDQKAIKSWWPRAGVWNAAGMNVDCWTHACESWFIDHRNRILSGQAQPLSGNDWRAALRMSRKAPKLIANMNAAALAFLESSQADILTQ